MAVALRFRSPACVTPCLGTDLPGVAQEKRSRDYEEFRQKHPDAPDPIRAEELQDASNRCVVNSSNRETPAQKEAKLAKETVRPCPAQSLRGAPACARSADAGRRRGWQGNKHFSKEEYKEAVEWFTKAVELAKPDCEGGGSEARKQLAVYYNNRAAAHWNLLMHDEAIADTTAAIKLDPRYVKARLCRAKVYEARKDVKAAYDDYKRAMSYEPSNSTASDGLKRLQPEMDKLAEEKLIEIKIPDEIPENRTIKYNVPGHGWIELELPEDAQPGQTIRLQLEEEEQEPEEEGGGGGLHRHADLYQKSLNTYFKDPVLSKIFSERWGKMQYEARLAVIDRTFDAMVQQTINNTTGYKVRPCPHPPAHALGARRRAARGGSRGGADGAARGAAVR